MIKLKMIHLAPQQALSAAEYCSQGIVRFKGRCVNAAKTLNYLFCSPLGGRVSPRPSPCSRHYFTGEISHRICKPVMSTALTALYSMAFGFYCGTIRLSPEPQWLLKGAAIVLLATPVYLNARIAQQSGRATGEILHHKLGPLPHAVPHTTSPAHRFSRRMALTAGVCTAGFMLFSVTGPVGGGLLYLQSSRFVLSTVALMVLSGLNALAAAHLEGRADTLRVKDN